MKINTQMILNAMKKADANNKLLPAGKDLLMSKVTIDENRKVPNPDAAPESTVGVALDKPRFGDSAEGYVSEKQADELAKAYVAGVVEACNQRGVNATELCELMSRI